MEYRILKYFLAVAKEENITHAAEILHISQPALSRQLMQLEEELGAQLFTRGKHSITLTEAGHLLRRRAQEITKRNEYSYFTALRCNAQKKREKDKSETRQKFFCIEVSSVEKSEFSDSKWTI